MTNQLIDKIVFPRIICESKPVRFTSKQTYDIIQEYVRCHIDGKFAEITSDYNFCFTVQKRIILDKEKAYTVNVNAWLPRKRKAKYETRYRKHRLVQIFEMTSENDKYKEYPVIQGFQGKNVTDLQNKIDNYLKNLIEFINEPLVDCPECGGTGVTQKWQPKNISEKLSKSSKGLDKK